MIDPLTLALIYAILKVCEGVSLNVISSTVFESIKDKIFKKKGKSEKELLKDVIQELKKSDIGDDSLKEIIENINCCIHVSSGQKRVPLFPANPKFQILNNIESKNHNDKNSEALFDNAPFSNAPRCKQRSIRG